jgi:hypothetical protein
MASEGVSVKTPMTADVNCHESYHSSCEDKWRKHSSISTKKHYIFIKLTDAARMIGIS